MQKFDLTPIFTFFQLKYDCSDRAGEEGCQLDS